MPPRQPGAMTEPDDLRADALQHAAEKRQARAARVRLLRRRIAGWSAALFFAVWGTVLLQGRNVSVAASGQSSASSSSDDEGDNASQSSDSPAAVTTHSS
jgi:hypothetical protein